MKTQFKLGLKARIMRTGKLQKFYIFQGKWWYRASSVGRILLDVFLLEHSTGIQRCLHRRRSGELSDFTGKISKQKNLVMRKKINLNFRCTTAYVPTDFTTKFLIMILRVVVYRVNKTLYCHPQT